MAAKITLMNENEIKPNNTSRPLMMAIKTKDQLYSLYMWQLINGGLFIPAATFAPAGSAPGVVPNLPTPGSKFMMMLTLLDDNLKKPVTGTVVWVNTKPSTLAAAGVGIHFEGNDANRQLKVQIENQLAGILGKSETRTQTM
jgi:Tfp pilus assembly protein PilZ